MDTRTQEVRGAEQARGTILGAQPRQPAGPDDPRIARWIAAHEQEVAEYSDVFQALAS